MHAPKECGSWFVCVSVCMSVTLTSRQLKARRAIGEIIKSEERENVIENIKSEERENVIENSDKSLLTRIR